MSDRYSGDSKVDATFHGADDERYGAEGVIPTPQQWLNRFLDATSEKRLAVAERVLNNGEVAARCFMQNHESLLSELQACQQRLSEVSAEACDAYQKGWEDALARMIAELDADAQRSGSGATS